MTGALRGGIPSKRALEAYQVILRFWRENGYSPTYREIGEAMGIHSESTVQRWMDMLEEAGWITREFGRPRRIRVRGRGDDA